MASDIVEKKNYVVYSRTFKHMIICFTQRYVPLALTVIGLIEPLPPFSPKKNPPKNQKTKNIQNSKASVSLQPSQFPSLP